MSEERRKKIKRKWFYLIISVFLIAFLVVAVTTNIFVKWYIPEGAPTIELTHPANHQIIYNNTTYFTWNSSDPDGDTLTHVYYADLHNTFNSPFLRAINVGSNTNYTPSPFMDGDWYWRVEVSDGDNVEVSETRHVVIKNNSLNNFPSLSNGDVSPVNGTTNTIFTYTVTFTDIDNDSADYVRVYIDGNPYNMTEANVSDTNTSDGKIYVYSTKLGTGLHNFSFICSDGYAINATSTTENKPYVTQTPTTQPSGGGVSSGIKMNKITIQPRNLEAYPGDSFEGNLIITDEGFGSRYEVYWYLVLLNENNTELSYDSGAVALDTTVFVPYVLLTDKNISTGTYRILAKTYDMPREKYSAEELGRDTISVKIVNEPIGSKIVEQVKSDKILQYFLIVFALILAVLTALWKRGVYLIFSIGITLLLLIVFRFVDFQMYSLVGIGLIMLGGLFFTRVRERIPIPIQSVKTIFGVLLIFIEFLLYFWQFT